MCRYVLYILQYRKEYLNYNVHDSYISEMLRAQVIQKWAQVCEANPEQPTLLGSCR